jgi:hypothetical protein
MWIFRPRHSLLGHFVILTKVILWNLFIAVLLENYKLANALEENGITRDDFEMFFSTWQKYDPHATQFIKVESLSIFISELESPFTVPRPNEKALAMFDLPINKYNMVHCLDVLHAVAKYAIGDDLEENAEFDDMQTRLDLQFLQVYPISTTLERKKQDLAAKKIQKAIKNYVIQKKIKK